MEVWQIQRAYAISAGPLQISPKRMFAKMSSKKGDEPQQDSSFVAQKFQAPFPVLFATLRCSQEHLDVSLAGVRDPRRLWTLIFAELDASRLPRKEAPPLSESMDVVPSERGGMGSEHMSPTHSHATRGSTDSCPLPAPSPLPSPSSSSSPLPSPLPFIAFASKIHHHHYHHHRSDKFFSFVSNPAFLWKVFQKKPSKGNPDLKRRRKPSLNRSRHHHHRRFHSPCQAIAKNMSEGT